VSTVGANCRPVDGGPAPIDAGRSDGSPEPVDASASDAAPFPADFPTCGDEACFCDALADCSAAEYQQSLPLGSRGRRVCGTAQGRCVVTAFSETEGGVVAFRCRLPAASMCPVTLDGTAPGCEQTANCNVLLGDCPDLLACE
jgi:hypothetical protein